MAPWPIRPTVIRWLGAVGPSPPKTQDGMMHGDRQGRRAWKSVVCQSPKPVSNRLLAHYRTPQRLHPPALALPAWTKVTVS